MNALHRDLKKMTELVENQATGKEPWRQGYHLMPPTGWLNDPNGLCQFQGAYHVFFQYAPLEAEGGIKFWGHYKSEDMVHWEYLGTALYADQPFDCHGAYSGSGLVEGDTLHLFYTGSVKLAGDFDYINDGRISSTVYTSTKDGIHFSPKKVLMDNEDYPRDCTCHVRDPKVWKEGETYYMVQGARRKGDAGEILVFTSKNKMEWQLLNRITTEIPFGYMWECPDYFRLGQEQILICCPQGVKQQGNKYQNLYQNGYFSLKGDIAGEYSLSEFTEMDYGFDFYAPQTFEDHKGRRILIGWMGMPDVEYYNPTVEDGWQHCLTVPRELTWKEGKLCQQPVSELESLRGDLEEGELNKGWTRRNTGFCDLLFEDLEGTEDFSLTLTDGRGAESGNQLKLTYQSEEKLFSLELAGELAAGRDVRYVEVEELKKLRILLDISSMEVYINQGQETLSTRYYPEGLVTLDVTAPQGRVRCWEMKC